MSGLKCFRVKNRMEKGDGMSFGEFSYPLMQAWDWWELFRRGVQVQIGGADQFGNILAGVEAIKAIKKTEPVHFDDSGTVKGHVGSVLTAAEKKASQRKFFDGGINKASRNINEPVGFTVPLLTTSAGMKVGKTAGNAVWLDKEMTSSFDLYQFFVRSADDEVERYLKLFTFIPTTEIRKIMDEHRMDESKRVAQHTLANEVLELLHGLGAAKEARDQHKKMFDLNNLSVQSIRDSVTSATSSPSEKAERPPGDWSPRLNKYANQTNPENRDSVHLKLPQSLVVGQPMHKVLWSAGLVSSKGEGQRLIANKGAHAGAQRGKDDEAVNMGDGLSFVPVGHDNIALGEDYVIDGDLLILRVGKWKMKIIKLVRDEEYERLGLTCPGWKDEAQVLSEESAMEERRKLLEFRTEKSKKRLARGVGREIPSEPYREEKE
jgi:tyrosyl-tRNA synthetase